MVKDLSQWIKQVILVVMFASLVDFLIPENKFLKYTKVFLGLVVMMTIINPVIVFLKSDYNPKVFPLMPESMANEEVFSFEMDKVNEKNNEIFISEYKERLKSYIKGELANITAYHIRDIQIQIVEDLASNDFGLVKSISIIVVEQQEQQDGDSDIDKIIIDRIKLTNEIEKSPRDASKDRSKELTKITNFLTSELKVSEEKIYLIWEE